MVRVMGKEDNLYGSNRDDISVMEAKEEKVITVKMDVEDLSKIPAFILLYGDGSSDCLKRKEMKDLDTAETRKREESKMTHKLWV